MAFAGAGNSEQALADVADKLAELDVARAPVGQHGVLDGARGGERPRREEVRHVLLAGRAPEGGRAEVGDRSHGRSCEAGDLSGRDHSGSHQCCQRASARQLQRLFRWSVFCSRLEAGAGAAPP
jgi:hypothetical protein